MKSLKDSLMNEAKKKYNIQDDNVQQAIDVIVDYFLKGGEDNAWDNVFDFLDDLDHRFVGKYSKIGDIVFDAIRDY